MRIAWFRASSFTPVTAASSTAVLRALGAHHDIDVITAADAHDFVIAQARQRYDLCVYQLGNAPGSEFMWAYLYHYPGVLLLDDRTLHDSRVRALERHRRLSEYEAEFQFDHGHPSRAGAGTFPRGSWPMLRAPMLASSLTVVHDDCWRAALEDMYPEARVRVVPVSAPGPADALPVAVNDSPAATCRVAVWGTSRTTTPERVIARARDAGAAVTLDDDAAGGWGDSAAGSSVDSRADIVVILDFPGETTGLAYALSAMARSQAVIMVEREPSAAWPALDPQIWRPRLTGTPDQPVVVSIDPRDEEHSLVHALRGLSLAPQQRRALGAAARSWWLAHATPEHAAREWLRVLSEAVAIDATRRPPDWPQHLGDWRKYASAVTSELGVSFPL
jgi:hypothetical protein